MLEIGGSQIVTAACRIDACVRPKRGVGVQNSLVCAAQLMIAGAALAAQADIAAGHGKSVLDAVVDDRGER
jgi:hypothetical protein